MKLTSLKLAITVELGRPRAATSFRPPFTSARQRFSNDWAANFISRLPTGRSAAAVRTMTHTFDGFLVQDRRDDRETARALARRGHVAYSIVETTRDRKAPAEGRR